MTGEADRGIDSVPDRVVLRGLRGYGRHGVLESERRLGQSFLVDVDLELDTREAAASDDVADTVDYGVVARSVLDVVDLPEGPARQAELRRVVVMVGKLR